MARWWQRRESDVLFGCAEPRGICDLWNEEFGQQSREPQERAACRRHSKD